MKRRSKENAATWNKRMNDLFKEYPEAKDLEYRYVAIRALLLQGHKKVLDIDKPAMIQILKDAIYLDRILRDATEGLQNELKQELSEEFQLSMGYGV